jgi:hypothetical protein
MSSNPSILTYFNGDTSPSTGKACLSLLIHYGILLPTVLVAHDYIVPQQQEQQQSPPDGYYSSTPCLLSYFALIYLLLLIVLRLSPSSSTPRPQTILELAWACNLSLLLTGVSPLLNRPLLATSSILAVSIDHILWYVDLIGYLFTGKFVSGVAKYLIWPETSFIKKVTCSHHIWGFPLVIVMVGSSSSRDELVDDFLAWGFKGYALSCVITLLSVGLSHFLTAERYRVRPQVKEEESSSLIRVTRSQDKKNDDTSDSSDEPFFYLNTNLSHSLWKDVPPLPFLPIIPNSYGPNRWRYLTRFIGTWCAINWIVYMLFYRGVIESIVMGGREGGGGERTRYY